jgi:predicted nucleic acid-binding protein
MTYLIDTCVMSEFVKKAPNPQVSQWFNQQPIEQLFLSSITIAEIKKGIFEEEFRSQNSGVRMQSVGDSDPPLIEDHQIENLVGVQKRRLFIHSFVQNSF